MPDQVAHRACAAPDAAHMVGAHPQAAGARALPTGIFAGAALARSALLVIVGRTAGRIVL